MNSLDPELLTQAKILLERRRAFRSRFELASGTIKDHFQSSQEIMGSFLARMDHRVNESLEAFERSVKRLEEHDARRARILENAKAKTAALELWLESLK